MTKEKVKYKPKFEKVDNKDKEERRRIFKMIDEGGPVYLEKVKEESENSNEDKWLKRCLVLLGIFFYGNCKLETLN